MGILIFWLVLAVIILFVMNNNKEKELDKVRTIQDYESRAMNNPKIFRNILFNGGKNSWYRKKNDEELKIIIADLFQSVRYGDFPEEELLMEAITYFDGSDFWFERYESIEKNNDKKKEMYQNYRIMRARYNNLDIKKLSNYIYTFTKEHWS